jgi:hypothetical protein
VVSDQENATDYKLIFGSLFVDITDFVKTRYLNALIAAHVDPHAVELRLLVEATVLNKPSCGKQCFD